MNKKVNIVGSAKAKNSQKRRPRIRLAGFWLNESDTFRLPYVDRPQVGDGGGLTGKTEKTVAVSGYGNKENRKQKNYGFRMAIYQYGGKGKCRNYWLGELNAGFKRNISEYFTETFHCSAYFFEMFCKKRRFLVGIVPIIFTCIEPIILLQSTAMAE